MRATLGRLSLVCSLLASARAQDDRAAWSAVASHCGEELRWAASWTEAATRARAEEKPVLAVAWMFDLFQVVDWARAGFAMDLDVIALVNERFVPLHLSRATEVPFAEQASYGISATALGAALLVVAPDGRVLAESACMEPAAACEFLRAFLAEHGEFPGAPPAEELGPEERAERLLARGELESAIALLAQTRSARGLLCEARVLRQQRDAEGALGALEAARTRAEDLAAELAGEIEREQLFVLLGLARTEPARALAERILTEHADEDAARAAEYALGLLDHAAGHADTARERWSALVERHPTSRWAAQAAALLLSAPAELELGLDLAAPRSDVLDSLRTLPWAALPASEAGAAAASAARWLLARQRADGGWPDATEYEGNARYFNPASVAIDALAGRALLVRGERVAAERALEGLCRTRSETQRWNGPEVENLETWSHAAWLELLGDALAAGVGDAPALRELGQELAQELVDRQRSNGGWSYFYATSMEADAVQLEQSISFVTAAVTLALMRAHEAGIEIDEDALASGLDALEAMRDEDGVFAYMLWSFQERAEKEQVAGAAGRGPVCELALLRGGRGDLVRLRSALELFFRHAPTLAKERGKALMHCGPEGQGCHYVLFDYATAARAIAELPEEERAPHRARLLALLLETRRSDGSFLDAPVLGPTSGTALALEALRWLASRE